MFVEFVVQGKQGRGEAEGAAEKRTLKGLQHNHLDFLC